MDKQDVLNKRKNIREQLKAKLFISRKETLKNPSIVS